MNVKSEGLKWINSTLKPCLSNEFELKFIDEQGGDLGDLYGVQFDSETLGGYVYFWSSGFLGFQLMDYKSEVELVEDTTEEIGSRAYEQVLNALILKLKECRERGRIST
ncbi:hypothetical protein [Microbulbifer sp. VVAC002]|uniref:hypothetical protein n=1 Tax=Microbulbifer sp. VVAC002 TaxID=3243387 RepID=UPI0040397BDE